LRRKEQIELKQLRLEHERDWERRKEGVGIQDDTHTPENLRIPTKLVKVGNLAEERADVEDEFFGGFRKWDQPWQEARCDKRLCGGRRGCACQRLKRVWGDGQSPWARLWGRVDITVERKLPHVKTPRLERVLGRRLLDAELTKLRKSRLPWQRAPHQWAAEQPAPPWPYGWRLVWEAEHAPPPELDEGRDDRPRRRLGGYAQPRWDLIEKWQCGAAKWKKRAQRQLSVSVQSWKSDEKIRAKLAEAFFGAAPPSKTASELLKGKRKPRPPQRLLVLPKVNIKLLPWASKKQVPKAELRAEVDGLIAEFFAAGGQREICPPETTTRMIEKRNEKRPVGRPPQGDKAMRGAERTRRWRRKKLNSIAILREQPNDRKRTRDRVRHPAPPAAMDRKPASKNVRK
jgi:hypothetical protein